MTYKFVKVLSNVKYNYFAYVNIVTIPNVDSNNLKQFKTAVLEFIRNKHSILN